MIGNFMRFRIKKTLVGIAALSLLVPMASHADVTPGKWIFDGFSRSTRDGKGATCLGSGGDTHAFDAPDCAGASASTKAAAEAEAKARKAARDQEIAAAKKASAEAKEFMPGGHRDFRVQRNDGIKLRDGLGRECVKNGSPVGGTTGNCADPAPQSARGIESVMAARSAAKKEAQAASAAAAAAATALPMVPGGALAEGQKGAYVYHPAGSSLRDGYGRSCVKDGQWHPALATEDCHPDLYNQWQAKAAPPQSDLIKRVQMPPPEAERAAELGAASPAVESAPAPAPAAAAAATESASKAPVVDEPAAEFPITKYAIDGDVAEAAALPTVAALAADVENDAADDDDEVVAESDETADDSDDMPVALATPDSVDAVDAGPVAIAAADDDDIEDEGNAPDEPDDDDDDAMPFLAGDMREEEDATLAMAEDGAADDDDDDAVLDEDDAPVAVFATDQDDSGEEEDEDLVASDEVEDDVESVYLGDADQVADAGEAPTLAMVADEDDDDDADASDDEEDDTDTVYLGDADQVADAGDVSTLAMVADDEEDDVFATDDDDDAPAAFAADEPASAAAPAAVVAAAEAPKAAPAPVALVDNKQVEFPVTRYEVEGTTPEPAKAPEAAVAPTANTECPPTTIQMEEGRFSFDRYTLRPTVVAKLDAIAGLLKSAKCDAIVITGHTDRIGTSKYNQRLSERRAAAAKSYLVTRKGIDESLVTIAGRGKSEPLTTAADCKGKRKKALIACYAPDRRVVITATTRKN